MWWLPLLLACRPAEGTDPSPTGDTGATATGPCAPTDHALRRRCVVQAPGTVRWWPEGEPEKVREVDGVDEVVIWGLVAGATTVVELPDGATIEVPPEPLPERIAGVATTHEGAALPSAVAVSGPCEGRDVVVLDPVGRVIGYEEIGVKVMSHDVSPEQTLLVTLSSTIREFDHTGQRLLDLGGFERPLHHDVARDAAGRTWLLNAGVTMGDERAYVLDGLYVLDAEGHLAAEWRLEDHLPIPLEGDGHGSYWSARFPEAADFSHGNSVETTESGDILLSFRWLDAVVAIGGDPGAADFGEPRWWLGSGVPSDFVLADPFQGQHHATLVGDTLTLFDNRDLDPARVVQYQLGAGLATRTAEWVLEGICMVQGAAYPLADGSVLATCSPGHVVEHLPAGGGPALARLDIQCADGPTALLNRAIPIAW